MAKNKEEDEKPEKEEPCITLTCMGTTRIVDTIYFNKDFSKWGFENHDGWIKGTVVDSRTFHVDTPDLELLCYLNLNGDVCAGIEHYLFGKKQLSGSSGSSITLTRRGVTRTVEQIYVSFDSLIWYWNPFKDRVKATVVDSTTFSVEEEDFEVRCGLTTEGDIDLDGMNYFFFGRKQLAVKSIGDTVPQEKGYCWKIHYAQAIILLGEARNGYPSHYWLAVGHLKEAGQELDRTGGDAGISRRIREQQLALESDKDYRLDLKLLEEDT